MPSDSSALGERAQHAGLVQGDVEASVVDGHVEDRAVEGVGHRAVEHRPAVLADRLQGRREVAPVVGEHRRAGADLGLPGRRLGVGAEAVVEPPAPDHPPHPEQLGRPLRVGELGQHALPRAQRAGQLDPPRTPSRRSPDPDACRQRRDRRDPGSDGSDSHSSLVAPHAASQPSSAPAGGTRLDDGPTGAARARIRDA